MVKHTQTIPRLLADELLSVFDHFVVLALTSFNHEKKEKYYNKWDTTFDSDNFQCYGVEAKVNWGEIKKKKLWHAYAYGSQRN